MGSNRHRKLDVDEHTKVKCVLDFDKNEAIFDVRFKQKWLKEQVSFDLDEHRNYYPCIGFVAQSDQDMKIKLTIDH